MWNEMKTKAMQKDLFATRPANATEFHYEYRHRHCISRLCRLIAVGMHKSGGAQFQFIF